METVAASNRIPPVHAPAGRATASFVFALLLASAAPWAAAAIPGVPTPARLSADLSFNFFPPDPVHVSTFGEHQLFGPGGRLRVDSALFPSPYVIASVPDIRDNFFGRVIATLVYEVVVAGPEGSVPVVFASAGEVQGSVLGPPLGSGAFALKATWTIENANSGQQIVEGGIVTPERSGSFFDSFADVVNLELTANQRYRVRLFADVGIANGTSNGGIGAAHALVDPVFSFAQGVGPEYSFVFSDGVGNLPVPEPSPFTLLAAGLVTLSLVGRRTQRRRGGGICATGSWP
jgi:hypothetical protein